METVITKIKKGDKFKVIHNKTYIKYNLKVNRIYMRDYEFFIGFDLNKDGLKTKGVVRYSEFAKEFKVIKIGD